MRHELHILQMHLDGKEAEAFERYAMELGRMALLLCEDHTAKAAFLLDLATQKAILLHAMQLQAQSHAQ